MNIFILPLAIHIYEWYGFNMKSTTHREIAEWLGINGSTLSNILSGKRRPGRDLAVHLEKRSGLSFSEWMLGSGPVLRQKLNRIYKERP